ncbi:MAG: heavy-metal-associated domain-containing protein [Akkermansiaceae bacterium]
MGCVKKVRSALEGVAGVSKAVVSMPDKAVVTYDPSKVKTKDLIAAVKKAGYKAKLKKEKKKAK